MTTFSIFMQYLSIVFHSISNSMTNKNNSCITSCKLKWVKLNTQVTKPTKPLKQPLQVTTYFSFTVRKIPSFNKIEVKL